MTVTVVFGKTSDGHLHSYDATYSTASNGPADGVNGGVYAYAGQNHNSGYQIFQSFIGFDYAAVPSTDIVTHAAIRLNIGNVFTPSIARDLEIRGLLWSGSGLTTADWRTTTQISAARLDGTIRLTDAAVGKWALATSDNFLTSMRTATNMEEIVVTSRQRSATVPTQDEGVSFFTADSDGTSADPQLIYTSAPRSTLFGVMGAQVEVSTGWAYLESDGAATPTINLKHREWNGTVTTIGAIPIGTAATDFAVPAGLQSLALVADESDNLFVLGKSGAAKNNLAGRAYTKGSGTTWTAQTLRTAGMPTYAESINQVVAAYHPIGGGSILVVVGHVGSVAITGSHTEIAQASISTPHLLTGTGSMVRGSGYSVPTLFPNMSNTNYFNTWGNETGTGLDVAAAAQTDGAAGWGYIIGGPVSQAVGDNVHAYEGRYILSDTGSSFSHTSSQELNVYHRKDAAGKSRVVPVSALAAAFVTTDHDSGWGLSISVRNHYGTESGSSSIGTWISGGDVTGMPNGTVIAYTAAWDVVYNETENRLWVYYVDTVNPLQVRRTPFDLNTMQPSLASTLVYTAASGNTIHGIRVQRNSPVSQSTLVTVALLNGTTHSTAYQVDTFNIAPTAPTLTPKANHDATTSQVYSWTFNDPNGDAQASYQLEISRVSDGVIVLDTGKVASATPSRTVAGGTIANGVDYRWRVKTWDPLDAESPWSDTSTFTASAGGSVTITSPATDYPFALITDDLPISWSVSGTTQAAYRVWLYRGATLVSDTNWIASTATTHTVSGMLSDQNHEIRVQVRNASNVTTNTASRFVMPSYATPEQPIISVSSQPENGFVLVQVENPAPGAPAIAAVEEDFESGVGTWTASPGATFTHDATLAHRGTGSGKMTVTGAGTYIYARDYTNKRAVTPGTRYTARMWVYSNTAGTVSAAIDWMLPSGDYLSTTAVGHVLVANTWSRIEVTGTCPDTSTLASFGPTIGPDPANGWTVNVDEAVLTVASDRPDVAENEILRRPFGSSGAWEVIGTTGPDGEYRDYTATAGITYEYRARGQA